MLRGIDAALELLGWSLAVFFVVLLFSGPRVVAEDKPESSGADAAGAAPYADQAGRDAEESAPPPEGEVVFTDTCGSCHTLSAAGTSGTRGPNLDDTALDAAAIEGIVRDGSGGMPAFGEDLSDDEITAVAEYVAGN
jgi:cytochrome c6